MPRFRPEAPAVDPVLSKLLWQALGLALLAVVLPPLTFGQALLGPAASFWLPALPALALLTLHRRFLATAWRAHLVRATPRRRQRFAARAARPVSRARRAAYARAA
ncbi:hypothetical protein [Arenimonas caeni]|uniref:Uncharacterized protein n=1 Tax=Arenimonas caeni TaxID=2058085 RepID=A0A2P6M8H3_9GAMM|nr:hypothetical protein [Arenimonas caeni]PRH82284.1 hypothetical protein C6N40_08520 [Arenimonas caeni]